MATNPPSSAGRRQGSQAREPLAPVAEGHRADRKEIALKARLFRDGKGGELLFEAWAVTSSLGLNGVYIESTAIPRVGTSLSVELFLENTKETLVAQGAVAFVNDLEQASYPPGFGLAFTEVDPENKERLMRYFVLRPVERCYELMIEEFPHLEKRFTLQDAALVINYWEDHKEALSREKA
jgi:Tfp pilus assembly protein PilZ